VWTDCPSPALRPAGGKWGFLDPPLTPTPPPPPCAPRGTALVKQFQLQSP